MNVKLTAKILGYMNDAGIEWNSEAERYKEQVIRELSSPLPKNEIQLLLKELSEKEKRIIGDTLDFTHVYKRKKVFPELVFLKEFNVYLQESKGDVVKKQRLILALLLVLTPVLEAIEGEELEDFIDEENRLIAEFGLWHCFWALYFHPDKYSKSDLWEEKLRQFKADYLSDERLIKENPPSNGIGASRLSDMRSTNQRKLEKLEQKVKKEVALRVQLELEISQKNKQIRQLEQELSQIGLKYEQVEHERLKEEKIFRQSLQQLEDQKEQLLKRENKLSLANQSLKSEVTQVKRNTEKIREALRLKDKELALLKKELRMTQEHLKKKPKLQTVLTQLSEQLALDLINLNKRIIEVHSQSNIIPQEYLQKTKWLLSFIEFLEEYSKQDLHREGDELEGDIGNEIDRQENRKRFEVEEQGGREGETEGEVGKKAKIEDTADSGDNVDEIDKADKEDETEYTEYSVCNAGKADKEDKADKEATVLSQAQQQVAQSRYDEISHGHAPAEAISGTFFRRTHGGYIELENGLQFNITESMVYQLDLQHEAEVNCTPIKNENDTTFYKIDLAFQGDDRYSPIMQYAGYVEVGENHIFYCVEMNNPSSRFQIHEKDVRVLQPSNGQPCTFNIIRGGSLARLSRLYKMYETPGKLPKQAQTQSVSQTLQVLNEKPEPFLVGSRIAIVGGLKKWFDDVISETGAELIHDDGYSPERIHATLKRADALFLLLSANSHRATWGCMDIAKKYQIPYFIIQGSKSNLRHLLWENRETILKA